MIEIVNLPAAYILLALLGLAVGSFLNVLIYRLPIMLHSEWNKESRETMKDETQTSTNVNLFLPRSFCPNCKTMIPALANIPLLSYLLLRGRCKHCKHPIPLRYPLVELMCCLLSLYAAFHFGFTLILPFALLFIWILIALFFIDLDHQLLPDSLTLGLLWVGLIANSYSLFTSLTNAVFSAAGAYILLWLIVKIFYFLTHKQGMGNGDFKLFAAFGAWFGWTQLPFILLFSSFIGAIIGIIYLKIKNKNTDTPIPFGPFLCVSGLISLFWGELIIRWYLQLLL